VTVFQAANRPFEDSTEQERQQAKYQHKPGFGQDPKEHEHQEERQWSKPGRDFLPGVIVSIFLLPLTGRDGLT
jgi:hypothetical protein